MSAATAPTVLGKPLPSGGSDEHDVPSRGLSHKTSGADSGGGRDSGSFSKLMRMADSTVDDSDYKDKDKSRACAIL